MTSRALTTTLTAAALGAVLALTGCGGGTGSSAAEPIEFQTSLAADSPMYAALEEVTAAYEQDNPDVDIDLKTAGTDYEAQIKVRLAARQVPDIFATHGWSLLRYSDFLAPLQDQPWAEDVNPALDSAMRSEDGALYALPVNTDVAGLVVNESVLEEVGVDPASITSWDAFLAAGDAVTAAGKTAMTIGGKDGKAGDATDWLASGAFTATDLEDLQSGTFASASWTRMVGAFETMRERGWINPDYSSATADDMAQALAAGDAAFALTSTSVIAQALTYQPDAALSFIPVPSIIGDPSYLIGGENTAFGVAKDGDRVADAEAYLAHLAQPENISALAGSIDAIPGLTSATADLGALQEAYDTYVVPEQVPVEPFFDRVYLPNGIWETIVSSSDGVVSGQSSPDEAAEQVAAEYENLYGQSQ